jgi:hypothetical protein
MLSTTYQGFSPLGDITGVRPLAAEVPKPPLRSALRFSQPLGDLLRTPACGPISSHATCRVYARSGFSRSVQFAYPHRPRLCPLAVATSLLADRSPRPQRGASTSRLFSTRTCVCCSLGLTALQIAPLLGFLPPLGFASSPSAPVTRSSFHLWRYRLCLRLRADSTDHLERFSSDKVGGLVSKLTGLLEAS